MISNPSINGGKRFVLRKRLAVIGIKSGKKALFINNYLFMIRIFLIVAANVSSSL